MTRLQRSNVLAKQFVISLRRMPTAGKNHAMALTLWGVNLRRFAEQIVATTEHALYGFATRLVVSMGKLSNAAISTQLQPEA